MLQLVLAALLGVFLILGSLYLVGSALMLGKTEFRTQLKVGNHIGFNVETARIDVGTGGQGDEITKTISVTNSFTEPAQVNIYVTGDIQNIIGIQENGFVLKSQESKTIELKAVIPRNGTKQKYEGTVQVVFFRLI